MSTPQVTVAVCTFKRPEGIARCLESLLALRTDFSYEIVVVENEPGQMSKAIIEGFVPRAADKGIELRYVCEPESNLSVARNRCAAECRGDFLALIDDDEWADPDWLQNLWNVQKETGADVVAGQPRAVYAEGFPKYLKNYEEHFEADALTVCEPPTRIYGFGACNVLLSSPLLKLREPLFDKSYGKTGCEDVDLGWFFHIEGRSMFLTGRAVTFEEEPLRRGWAIFYWERAFRNGINYSRIFQRYFYRMAGLKASLRMALKKTRDIFYEMLWIPFAPRRSMFRILFQMCFITGLFGYFLGFRKKGY